MTPDTFRRDARHSSLLRHLATVAALVGCGIELLAADGTPLLVAAVVFLTGAMVIDGIREREPNEL